MMQWVLLALVVAFFGVIELASFATSRVWLRFDQA
jgi:hypothetical protein